MRLRTFIVVAFILPLAATAVPGAGESGVGPEGAPVCTADGLLVDGARATYPVLEPSLPGWWRQELKLQTPELRDPGTLSILPPNPAPAEVSTEGRWLPGYRPATPQALAGIRGRTYVLPDDINVGYHNIGIFQR